jgi:hypothetical protein
VRTGVGIGVGESSHCGPAGVRRRCGIKVDVLDSGEV